MFVLTNSMGAANVPIRVQF